MTTSPSTKRSQARSGSIRPSAYSLRGITPPLRTRLSLATSSQRPATLTQQQTLGLIAETLEAVSRA